MAGYANCATATTFCVNPQRSGGLRCHSEVMSISGSATRRYWCLRHDRLETDDNAGAERDQLGPYAAATQAQRVLENVAERNDQWNAEDARWSGEQP